MTPKLVGIPEIETERLRLRAPRASDFEALAAFYASERSRFVGGPRSRSESWRGLATLHGHWAMRGFGIWMLERRADGAHLGWSGLLMPEDWPGGEVAWTLFDGFEGHGYATEGARAARAHAYGALGWSTAISVIDPENAASEAVARRLGARPEGRWTHPEAGWSARLWRHPDPAALAEETAA
jgi:RimJ/RimL family protein N-acetyltransferase